MEGSAMDGGVLIVHQLNDGKHQYEVKSVLKHQRKHGEKFFFRGDRLRLVNETELQDVPPEELAQILSKGNPMLTVHKTVRKKEPVVVMPEDEDNDVMIPFSKTEMTLRISQEMIREDPGQDNFSPPGDEEEDICTEESVQSDFLVVSMKKTSISVIKGRSCDPREPCHECEVTCQYNDIVMVTESSTVTLVPRGGGYFSHLKTKEAVVEHSSSSRYIRSLCSQNRAYVSDHPERICIYYYKSQTNDRGIPVVLNFAGSDCFLKCSKNEETVELQVEVCEKQKLKKISRSDHQILAFVFYMKSERTGNTTFESALHSGWFIQISEPDTGADSEVHMINTAQPQEDNYFIIVIKTCQSC